MIEADAPTAPVDRPVHLHIGGLPPGEEVTVDAQAVDWQGQQWGARAVFRADAHGLVAPDTARPRSGTYQDPDGMGLFWSMAPRSGDPESSSFFPRVSPQHSYDVTLTVSAHGHPLATRTLTRTWWGPGVSSRTLSLATDRVCGELFLPAPGTPRHPAVLVLGGSEGGNGETPTAALLASHGYPALALGYFGLPGLPRTLENIPLEYFATAARLLAAQPGTDPAHLLAMGYSRGSEAALLLADDYPDLVHGAVLYSPSAQVNGAFPGPGTTAWTKDGKAVAQGPIALDRISGPVLALAGADDRLWPSPLWARQIVRELDDTGNRYPHRAQVFPNAGHGVGTYPYLAAGTRAVQPVTGRAITLGGSRQGNAAARATGWPEVLALLATLSH
ncbi:acyl-CoA thioesterase/BAAT N-terminal domain-containing protein [Kitasatospora sp. NPDC059571]|uniref:acyl-CoA thioesterase/BAAT N-terminal domain-containing protein n=1 Tax=Kitasatospora sp. NPDC059571 TaxID=3346871 RepID=UPI0036C164E4